MAINKEQLLRSICDMHSEVNERSALLKKFLSVYSKNDVLTGMQGVIQFFNVSVVHHFSEEKIIFNALLNKSDLDHETLKTLKEILKQHDELTAEFIQLKEISEKIESSGDTDLSDGFIDKANKVIWSLLKHAQVEDEIIFPKLADAFNDNEFKVLEAELLKI